MKTLGRPGRSGLDAYEWRRLLTTFIATSTDLCIVLAKLAIRIETSQLIFLFPSNPYRLIALDVVSLTHLHLSLVVCFLMQSRFVLQFFQLIFLYYNVIL